jgi:hypothetical protein
MKFPPEIRDRIVKFYTNPNLYETMVKEVEVCNQCARETKAFGAFPDVPLTVLAHDPKHSMRLLVDDGIPESEAKMFEDTWYDLIAEQSRLSKYGELVTALNASHEIYEDRPDLIIQVINGLVSLLLRSQHQS